MLPKAWLPNVKSGCCGCCSLETCCKVQGYLRMVMTLLLSVLLGIGTVAGAVETVSICSKDEEIALCSLMKVKVTCVLAVTVFFLAESAAAIAFIRGIKMGRPDLLIPFNWLHAFHMLFDLLLLVWMLFLPAHSVYYICFDLLDFGLAFYMMVCAETLYHKMKEGSSSLLVNEV